MPKTEGLVVTTSGLPNEVPLFPLPDHVLLPGSPAPYRVFEPRYLAMIEDLLAEPEDERWIAVPRLEAGWQADYHASPAFHPIATVGRVTTCEPMPGGHWYALVEGVARVRLHERPARGPYRIARVEPIADLPVGAAERRRLERLLETCFQAVFALTRLLGTSAEDLALAASTPALPDPSLLLDRLATCAMDRADDRQAVLDEPSLLVRAERVVEALSGLVVLASRHAGAPAAA